MNIKVINNDADHQAALLALGKLMDAAPTDGTPEADQLALLVLVIGDYEDRHYPIDPPDPIDAIVFRMDQQGLKQRDLIPYIGSASKVSEVLSRKRPLSINMVRRLHQGLGIPAEVLIKEVLVNQARGEQGPSNTGDGPDPGKTTESSAGHRHRAHSM